MALLTTEDVLNKKFQYVKFREGYDQVEVDEFLDEVVSTIYTLQMENQDLKEKLEAAERRIAELSHDEAPAPADHEPAPVAASVVEEPVAAAPIVEEPVVEAPVVQEQPMSESAQSATSMLALAQRVHDEYVRDGKEESDRIVAEARAKGDEIIADAQKQHETILAQLDQERGLLETKINELRTFESEYRSNLRGHLETLLSEINAGGEA
ncbi:DivIVA domain-containing protein [Actinomyces sp. B33]|uniref:DivIVA domain-containing protein n=1 Tax=Actinomyces sp. B33 TaxID=2942131 RepID=UPI002342004C|nr:DivIVA domain-containing protein [Actinomyces sp. B33]MDC4233089.1 DivIVA domain-containing protein [Actinomyces sp. B33]